jgi:hypothetical protein
MSMNQRKLIAGAFAAAAVALGVGGAVAAAHPVGGAAVQGPAVAPANQPDTPGVVDTPEPGDTPDGPGDAAGGAGH